MRSCFFKADKSRVVAFDITSEPAMVMGPVNPIEQTEWILASDR